MTTFLSHDEAVTQQGVKDIKKKCFTQCTVTHTQCRQKSYSSYYRQCGDSDYCLDISSDS